VYIYYVINNKDMENLIGKIVDVIVSKNGKVGTKSLKVCKANSRSVLFIEVDKENRKNTFRKFKVKNVEKVGTKTDGGTFVLIEDGVLPDKWESSWDAIGTNPTPSYARPYYSNHSKGWSATIRPARGSSMDALAVSVSTRSTTNSSAGFPMV
jgi:hypothetical protein